MQYPAGASVRSPEPACPAPGFRRWAGEYLREARKVSAAKQAYPAFLPAFAVFLVFLLTLIATTGGARAQDAGLMANGDLAVTGFSGTRDMGGQTFIDTGSASLKVLDVSGKGAATGQLINAPAKFEALARDIGQVFGIALDNAPNPNIYATSTSVHGLQIVIPDANGDGVPERVQTGQAGAMFMDGQFGTTLGGGPGTIWRIDGTTGEISRFADIASGGLPNSGPGLGNIAFDPAHYQFYVSDLDTGNIHRLDLSGNELGMFDHGTQGRPAAGLAPVGVNIAARMDVSNAAFDSANPDTWGLADPRRRVWGLAYFSGRLYYAVAQGPQIWSVGINDDGSFAGDARIEINAVPGAQPVSDILFAPHGRMILAQRGGILGSADYTTYHAPGQNRVLRYSRDEAGNWVPQPDEYAIGFPVDHKNASGGVGLACDGTLWSTGDALRNDPPVVGDGPFVVHGLQGNDINFVRPFNVPPRASWFVDYDNHFSDAENAGHVGDVEVYRNCQGGRAETWPGWYPIPEWTPPDGWVPPVWWPREPDLDIEKIAHECTAVPGLVPTFDCKYTIVVTNNGAADFVGHLDVDDNPPAGGLFMPPPGGSIPWTCAQPGGAGTQVNCDSDNVETLHPGESETLEITIRLFDPDTEQPIRNCAVIDDPFDFWPNEDCDDSQLPEPDLEMDKAFFGCVLEGAAQRCYFVLTMSNVGPVPYQGPLHFVENIPAGTVFGGIHDSSSPGWGCVGGPPVECTLPDPPGVTLNPGSAEQVLISVIVPAGMGGDMENCVNFGGPEHDDDPVVPGVNEACEPFTAPAPPPPLPPVKHSCPDGWQDVPPGDAPAGWKVIVIDGINPDGSGWSKMCMKPDPKVKAPVIEHNCPAGWQKVPPQGAPAGWQVVVIDGVNPDGSKWGIKCMKPKPKKPAPKCPTGWVKVPPQGAPAGWQVIAVDGVYPDGTKWGLMCMKPKPKQPQHNCPSGWTKVPPQGLPAGYQMMIVDGVDPDGSKWGLKCMKPKPETSNPPQCGKGEKAFSSARLVPKGWTSRKVTSGKQTVWCAKPGLTYPNPVGPKCLPGEKQVTSPRNAPKGWTVRSVVSGKRKIYCAKPGTLIPVKPRCVGGKLVMLKTMPPRWRCLCPAKTQLKNGKCTSVGSDIKNPQSTVPPSSTPEIKPCPKNWKRFRGKCFPPKIKVKPTIKVKPKVKACPKNWNRVRGNCVPPKIQINPNLKVRPKSQSKPTIKRLPSNVTQPKRNTGKVMMLAPATNLKTVKPKRRFW